MARNATYDSAMKTMGMKMTPWWGVGSWFFSQTHQHRMFDWKGSKQHWESPTKQSTESICRSLLAACTLQVTAATTGSEPLFLKAEGSKHRKLFGIPWSFDSCKPVRQSSKLGYKQHLLIEIWFDLLHRYHIHGHITSQRDMFMVHLAAKETTVYNRFWQTKKREDTFIQIQWVKMRHVWCRHWWHGHTTTAGQIVSAF